VSLPAFDVLFGASLLYTLVLLPAWGNPRHKAGGLPPRLMRRLTYIAWAAVIVAAAGTALAIVQQTSALLGVDLGTVLREGLISVVMSGTQIGDTLRARLIFIAMAAGLLGAAGYVANRVPLLVAPLWTTISLAAAFALGTLSLSSHAAGVDLWLLPSIIAHWLHLLATAAWVGGLLTLAAAIPPALAPLPPAERHSAIRAVLRRFSRFAVGGVALLVATGIYNSGLWLRRPEDAWTTPYGLTLLAKIALIAPPLLLAFYHHLGSAEDALTQRFGAWAGRAAQRLTTFGRTIRLEAILAVVVVVGAGVLAATPPPIPTETAGGTLPTQSTMVDGVLITLRLDPGAAGANAYEVRLESPASSAASDSTALGKASVWVRFVYPALDLRTAPIRFDSSGEGTYLFAGAELNRAGMWQTVIDLERDGRFTRAAFIWEIPAVPASLYVRTASLYNLFGAALLIAVIGWLSLPPLVRRVWRLDLHPGAALIGVSLALVTGIILVVGVILITRSTEQIDQLRYPPPEVVNPIVPDGASLQRGAAVWAVHCAACHTAEQQAPFSRTLSSRRDAALRRAILGGVGAMPAVPLSEDEVWAVISYLRSPPFFGLSSN